MNNPETLKKEVREALGSLEQKRTAMVDKINRIRYFHAIPILLAIVRVITYSKYPSDSIGVQFVLIFIIGLGIEAFIHEEKKQFLEHSKNNIINLYLKFLYPKTQYLPNEFAYQHHLKNSKLFGSFNNYFAEDGFRGRTKHGYPFQFFEILVSKENSTDAVTVRDLFWTIHPSNIDYKQIMILSKHKATSSIVDKIIQTFKRVPLQVLDFSDIHPAFAQEFVVHSISKDEAVHLLTPEFCQQLVDIRQQCDAPISMSFVEKQVYLWVYNQDNFFDLDFNKPVELNLLHRKLYRELTSCFGILDQLSVQLNEQKPYEKPAPEDDNWDNPAYDHLIDTND